jgi:hypothetical protein
MTDSSLTPREGLSDFWIEFEKLEAAGRGDSVITFRIIRLDDGQERFQANLSFHVSAENDGASGQIARAYDLAIDAMRQMIFQADQVRAVYRKEAAQIVRGHTSGA